VKLRFAVLVAVVAALALVAIPGAPAEPRNSEQVVFSGIGPGNQGPFGFWIWCMAEASDASTGAYEGVCAGSMYFYALGIVRGVFGWVTEPSEGVYQMNVSSSDGSVSCILWNGTPVLRGPRNTVNAACGSPSGFSGISTNAVVNVTGP